MMPVTSLTLIKYKYMIDIMCIVNKLIGAKHLSALTTVIRIIDVGHFKACGQRLVLDHE